MRTPISEPHRRRVGRRLLTPLAIAAAAVLAPVITAQPAFAAPGGSHPIASSPNDTAAQKVVRVTCPSGTVATGGDAELPSNIDAWVNTIQPDEHGVTVLAIARAGQTQSWQLYAGANCIPAPAGLEYKAVASPLDSSAEHTATAACPSGKALIGMGGSINSNGVGQDKLGLDAVRTNAPYTSVVAHAKEDPSGFATAWNVSATAVCATPLPGLTVRSASSALDSSDNKGAVAECPTGTTVQSGGFDVSGGNGRAVTDDLFFAVGRGSGFAEFAVYGSARGYPNGSWRLLSQAICASQ